MSRDEVLFLSIFMLKRVKLTGYTLQKLLLARLEMFKGHSVLKKTTQKAIFNTPGE